MNIKTARTDHAYLLLNAQLEMLIHEDTLLTKIVGATLMFLSGLEGAVLPPRAAGAADLLAQLITEVPENTIYEARQLADSVR
ncbi:MAG: hypothetical protein ABFE02_06735 [Sulfuricella sp.]